MTKGTVISKSTKRLIITWVVIGILTIGIMKASAITKQAEASPIFRPLPALNWHTSF
jgi:hypothetical protein